MDLKAGIFLHLTSLPSKYGVGNIGKSARDFVKILKQKGFKYWQFCPLTPTGFGDSPYQALSSFALNPYFLDLDELVEFNILSSNDLSPLLDLSKTQVEFGKLYFLFEKIKDKIFQNVSENFSLLEKYGDFEKFKKENEFWLKPWSYFISIKNSKSGQDWINWEEIQLKDYKKALKCPTIKDLHFSILKEEILQFLLYFQFEKFKKFATENDVLLVGDVPIFVSADSSDIWSNTDLFDVDKNFHLKTKAGVPPDYFSEDGQLWGNPLYKWKKHKDSSYKWWIQRLKASFRFCDVLRIDHFRAFADFWEIPASAKSAKEGSWKNGPGIDFFNKIKGVFKDKKIVLEDLGLLSDKAIKLRDDTDLDAMGVLQFAFGGADPKNPYLPHNLKRNIFLYTGTHDNDTTKSWYDSSDEKTKDFFRQYLRVSGENASWDMIHLALTSAANTVIIPAQDFLSLGAFARFNTPGKASGNWSWRMTYEQMQEIKDNLYINNLLKLTSRQ